MTRLNLPKDYSDYAYLSIPMSTFFPKAKNEIYMRAKVFYIINLESQSSKPARLTKMVCVTDMKEVPTSLKRLEERGNNGEITKYQYRGKELVLVSPSEWKEKYTSNFSKKENVVFMVSDRKVLRGNPDALKSKYNISVPLDGNQEKTENDMKFFLNYMIQANSPTIFRRQ